MYNPPPADQPPYGQQPYGQPQQPYGQPPQQPYGQPMYGPPPGYAPPPPQPGSTSQWGPSSIGMEPNISAGLGYLVNIIAIIFFFMEKQNRFVKFHTAQAILLNIAYVVAFFIWFAGFFIVVLGAGAATSTDTNAGTIAGLGLILFTLCGGILIVAYLVAWIWGLVAAFTGRVVKFPLLGAIAQRWAGGPVVPVAPVMPGMPGMPGMPYAPPPPGYQ